MPLISVILPTYNRARLLPRAISSVLAQTCRDFELLIIDDGSEDETAEVVAGFRDPRIRYERIAHRGYAAALNRGCAVASGEALAFIDSDDEWLPTKLERQLNALRSHGAEVGVVVTGSRAVNDVTGEVRAHPVRAGGVVWLFDALLERRIPTTFPAVVVRRECFDRVGAFDESLDAGQDREWLLRVAKHYAFFQIPERLVVVHKHAASRLGGNVTARIAYERVMLERYAAELQERPRILAQSLVRVGGLCLRQEHWRDARASFWQAVMAAPLYLPAYFYLLVSVIRQIRAGLRRRLRWAAVEGRAH
ncbi:MAG: glycosyltransferase family 2 protein [bacterium]